MSEALRQWLATELNRRKWSQRELSRQMGVSSPFVSNVLSGAKGPSVNFCHKVARAFDVAPETVLRLAGILPGEPAPTDTPGPVTSEIISLIEKLPPEKRKQVLEYVRFISR